METGHYEPRLNPVIYKPIHTQTFSPGNNQSAASEMCGEHLNSTYRQEILHASQSPVSSQRGSRVKEEVTWLMYTISTVDMRLSEHGMSHRQNAFGQGCLPSSVAPPTFTYMEVLVMHSGYSPVKKSECGRALKNSRDME
ncbi:hypothetical protein E2C01_034950 [Portunus trituberculatus]|uniref:Uncharacterized protein n=1 Tax=Portunus trituberculatus TaxID=210409 RepID=A0A5B7F482_PORTR|nr:hypothetical protein [Portunus trituberculatus]